MGHEKFDTSEKPTLLFIHGAWGTPESYSKILRALESAGYDVAFPSLPSMNGNRPPTAGLQEDTEFVRSYIKELLNKGKRVIAIMHSYGGQVGTSALTGTGLNERSKAGFPGGVSHLVYMTAFAMPEGGAMMDKVKEFSHMDLIPLAFDIAEDGTCVNRDPKTLMIGPGIDDDEADACVLAMGRWNGGAMYERITNCAWREISVSYIYTTQDMTVPYDYQKSFVEGMRAQGREVNTFELETGHAPHLTKTEEVVDIINQVAGI